MYPVPSKQQESNIKMRTLLFRVKTNQFRSTQKSGFFEEPVNSQSAHSGVVKTKYNRPSATL
jgi:hypothetical protein